MYNIEDVFNIDVVKNEVKSYAGVFVRNRYGGDYFDSDNNEYSAIICTLVSEANGHNIPGLVLDVFGFTPQEVNESFCGVWDDECREVGYASWMPFVKWANEQEWIHDVVMQEIEGAMSDRINELVKPEIGNLSLGYDWNGAFSLMYYVSDDELPEEEE